MPLTAVPPRLVCLRRAALSPALSADAGDAFWRGLAPTPLVDTVTGGPPAQATHFRVAWDTREWRLLFDCEDTRPWATLRERDAALWTEEVVEVFVDPVGDGASYFELEINPLGAVCDLVLRRIRSGWRKDFAWRVDGLRSHVRVSAGGWAAELALPFASLVADPPTPGSIWRANFLRIDRPGGGGSEAELSAWSPTGVRNFHRVASFGHMEFTG